MRIGTLFSRDIEPYGVTDPAWAGDASPALSADLRALELQTQSP